MRYEPHILGAISGYEFVALVAHSPRLPTITSMVRPLPWYVRWPLAVAAGGWTVLHLGRR